MITQGDPMNIVQRCTHKADCKMDHRINETHILIIEDHPLYATGMRELVEFVISDVKVFTVSSMKEALGHLATKVPILIIADLKLNDSEGMATADTLRRADARTPILFMSGDEALLAWLEKRNLHRCYAMPKTGDFHQTSQMLLTCISRASVIANWRSPHINGKHFSQRNKMSPNGTRIQLTQKQREVMSLLVNGMSNKEIARQLVLSPETIKTHLREIFTRMNVRNRTQAVGLFKKMPSLADLSPN
jgi:DNA-binding NarL/FixJ family response regulator